MGYRIRKAISDDEQRIRELFIEMLQTIYHTEEVEGYEYRLYSAALTVEQLLNMEEKNDYE